MVGILAIFAMGIRREEKAYSLGSASPCRIAGGLRAVTSAYAHPQLPELGSHQRQSLALAGARSATTAGASSHQASTR